MDTWSRVKYIMMAAGAILGAWWGVMPELVKALLYLMALDFATGYAAAFVTGQASSDVGARGVLKKLAILAGLTTAYIMEQYLQIPIAQAAAMAWCVTEITSILENLVRMGVPVPDAIRAALAESSKRKIARGKTAS